MPRSASPTDNRSRADASGSHSAPVPTTETVIEGCAPQSSASAVAWPSRWASTARQPPVPALRPAAGSRGGRVRRTHPPPPQSPAATPRRSARPPRAHPAHCSPFPRGGRRHRGPATGRPRAALPQPAAPRWPARCACSTLSSTSTWQQVAATPSRCTRSSRSRAPVATFSIASASTPIGTLASTRAARSRPPLAPEEESTQATRSTMGGTGDVVVRVGHNLKLAGRPWSRSGITPGRCRCPSPTCTAW